MLPTVLVCPFRRDDTLTQVRTLVRWQGFVWIVLCDLARPINRQILTRVGTLDETDSRRVLATFGLLLAR